MNILIPKQELSEVITGNDGYNIYIKQGNNIIKFPAIDPVTGRKVSQTIRTHIKIQENRVEQKLLRNNIVADQAMIMRLGLPVGLTSDPSMLKEAGTEAYHNPELRKYITGKRAKGLETRSVIYPPILIQHKPKQEVKHG